VEKEEGPEDDCRTLQIAGESGSDLNMRYQHDDGKMGRSD
jgi:hypothetical protein